MNIWQIKFAKFRKNKFIWPNVDDEEVVDTTNYSPNPQRNDVESSFP